MKRALVLGLLLASGASAQEDLPWLKKPNAIQLSLPFDVPGCYATGSALGTKGETITVARAGTKTCTGVGTCAANQLCVDALGADITTDIVSVTAPLSSPAYCLSGVFAPTLPWSDTTAIRTLLAMGTNGGPNQIRLRVTQTAGQIDHLTFDGATASKSVIYSSGLTDSRELGISACATGGTLGIATDGVARPTTNGSTGGTGMPSTMPTTLYLGTASNGVQSGNVHIRAVQVCASSDVTRCRPARANQTLATARAEPPAAPLSTPVPYTGTEIVHPSVVDAGPSGWNGYRYWMGITPYAGSSSAIENPSIYASNDGQTWVTPPGVTNPLVPCPGAPGTAHNADPELVLAGGTLHYFFLQELATNPATNVVSLITSMDGSTWTSPVHVLTLTTGTDGSASSPSVLYDSGTWTMFYANNYASPAVLYKRTASSATGPWSSATAITITAPVTGREYWHLAAAKVGSKTVLAIDQAPQGQSGLGGDLWLAYSDDGATFTRAVSPMVVHGGGWTASGVYRSSLVPLTSGGSTVLRVWLGGTGPLGWRVGYVETTIATP